MKTFPLLTVALLICISAATSFGQGKVGGWDPDKPSKEQKKDLSYEDAILAFKNEDAGIERFFDNAYAFALFPSVGKGAFVVGGAHGNGRVYQDGAVIAETELTQATVGLALGGQSYSEIIFFRDEAAFDNFKKGKLKFSGQASAVAVVAGASADVSYSDGVAVFTMAKGGLMYEASIGGQSFKYKPLQ